MKRRHSGPSRRTVHRHNTLTHAHTDTNTHIGHGATTTSRAVPRQPQAAQRNTRARTHTNKQDTQPPHAHAEYTRRATWVTTIPFQANPTHTRTPQQLLDQPGKPVQADTNTSTVAQRRLYCPRGNTSPARHTRGSSALWRPCATPVQPWWRTRCTQRRPGRTRGPRPVATGTASH